MFHPGPAHNPVLAQLLIVSLPVVFIALAIPLLLGRIRPNFLYGVRTPKTMASPELWYRANRSAGYAMLLATAIGLLGWVVLALTPLDARSRSALDVLLLCLLNVAALVISAARAGAF